MICIKKIKKYQRSIRSIVIQIWLWWFKSILLFQKIIILSIYQLEFVAFKSGLPKNHDFFYIFVI